jgi:hypothetical protein
MKRQAEEQVDTQMKTVTNINNIQNMDVDKVVKLLQEQGLPQDFVNDVLEFMKNKTQENTSQAPVAPSPGIPQTMNPIPKVMKPIGKHLDSAVQYLAVWAEPARPLGPNADIPSLAEAADEAEIDLENKPEPSKKEMSSEEIKKLGESIGVKWEAVKFTPEALTQGYKVELEHGTISPDTNITNDDPTMTAKIAWAHLNEHADYYNGLQQMEDTLAKAKGNSGVTASSIRRYAVTVRELQQTILPQLEDQLFEIDAALQSGMVEEARAALFEATATLSQIKQKISALGDVDPVTFGPSEEPQQKSLVDKLLGR